MLWWILFLITVLLQLVSYKDSNFGGGTEHV